VITIENTRPRIFEQFHQVDSSNTKAKGGTGLGRAIAKQILDVHAGRIWVEFDARQGLDLSDGAAGSCRVSPGGVMTKPIPADEGQEDLRGVLRFPSGDKALGRSPSENANNFTR
jgi:histidine kinase/DNA gyrase B/HSP90-like ATPase